MLQIYSVSLAPCFNCPQVIHNLTVLHKLSTSHPIPPVPLAVTCWTTLRPIKDSPAVNKGTPSRLLSRFSYAPVCNRIACPSVGIGYAIERAIQLPVALYSVTLPLITPALSAMGYVLAPASVPASYARRTLAHRGRLPDSLGLPCPSSACST